MVQLRRGSSHLAIRRHVDNCQVQNIFLDMSLTTFQSLPLITVHFQARSIVLFTAAQLTLRFAGTLALVLNLLHAAVVLVQHATLLFIDALFLAAAAGLRVRVDCAAGDETDKATVGSSVVRVQISIGEALVGWGGEDVAGILGGVAGTSATVEVVVEGVKSILDFLLA